MPDQTDLEAIARDVLARERAAGEDDITQTGRAVRAVMKAQDQPDASAALAIVSRVRRE